MRFASLGSSNTSDYAAAGKAVANSAAKTFAIQRKTGPDYGDLSMTAMKTNAAEKIAAIKASANVAKAGISAYSDVTKTGQKVAAFNEKNKIALNQRKAGMLGAFGKIAGAGFLASRDNTKDRKYPTADRKGIDADFKAKRGELLSGTEKSRDALYSESEAATKALSSDTSNASNPSAVSGGKPGKVDTGVASAPTSAYSLTGNSKIVADAIAGPESGSWGYEAFNQGGAAGGTRVLGKSGSHKDTFGRSLTDMSFNEIFQKQNMAGSDSSFRANGGLHAVGRYQFIGSTLQDEVKRMGLPLDTKFTPQVQDNVFLNHIKRVGNISPWVGPSTKWDQNKKNQINSLIPTL